MAVAISLTADPAGAGSGTTITYSGVSTGAADPGRVVVVCAGTELSSGTPSSATIDGTAMSAGTLGTTGAMGARIFWKPWPTGTTANIAVTFGASHADGTTQHICVYRVTGASGTASAESAVGDTDADPISSGAITIPTGGGCIGVAVFAVDTTARTWTGITEDPSVDEDAGTFRFTTGTSTTAGTPTITVSGGNNEDGALAWLILKPGGTITVEAGSYTYTGTAASLERGRKVVADAGSYTYTGTDATLRVGHPLSAGAGSYTYTGSDASLEVGYKVVAGAGSYTYTGTDASLEVGHRLNAETGSYAYSGTDASPEVGYKVSAGAGSYTYTGSDVTLTIGTAGITLSVDGGTYTYTGGDAGLTKERPLYAVEIQHPVNCLMIDEGALSSMKKRITEWNIPKPDTRERATATKSQPAKLVKRLTIPKSWLQ